MGRRTWGRRGGVARGYRFAPKELGLRKCAQCWDSGSKPGVERQWNAIAASETKLLFHSWLSNHDFLSVKRTYVGPQIACGEQSSVGAKMVAAGSSRETTAAVVELPLVRYRFHEFNTKGQVWKNAAVDTVMIADHVIAKPESYPPGATALFRRKKLQSALYLVRLGCFAEAKRPLAETARTQPSPAAICGYLLGLRGR